MDGFQAFEQELRDALGQLRNPTYQPSALLCSILGCDPHAGPGAVQAAITQAISDLRPAAAGPLTGRSQRFFELLSFRYLQQRTQEDAAARLGIGPRHLRREQQLAVTALASHLWRRSGRQAGAGGGQAVEREVPSWRSQVKQELALLHEWSAPGNVCDVEEVAEKATSLARALIARNGVTLAPTSIEAGLLAAIHPSALRQILLGAVAELVRHMEGGVIDVAATREGRRISVRVTGAPAQAEEPLQDSLVEELAAMQGGHVRLHRGDDALSICLDLPSAGQITVMVIDDNPDLVHLYRRYTLGTEYQIVALTEGQRALEMIDSLAPDVIVLDVMLPDVDGWELLVHLHDHPASRSIPIIVCSVVREEELSLALGATLYMPKPVGPAQFLEALDCALNPAAGGERTARANNEAAC